MHFWNTFRRSALTLLLLAPDASSVELVTVKGQRDPEWRRYPAFAAGLQKFDQIRTQVPGANLNFRLLPSTPTEPLRRVRIAGNLQDAVIPVDENGRFALPLLAWAVEENAELLLDVPRKSVRWRPEVRTAGLPEGQRRLGDLRVECEVLWAIEQHDVPALMRFVFNRAGGPCKSTDVKVPFLSAVRLQAVTLMHPNGRDQVSLELAPDGLSFVAPISSAKMPDDAILVLEAAKDPGK